MGYYFVKLGPGNSLAVPLLEEERLSQPAVVGFFRDVRLPAIQDIGPDQRPRFSRQAVDLYHWAKGDLSGFAVTVAQGQLWVLEPTGPMYEMERELFEKSVGPTPHDDDVPKLVPVHVVYTDSLTHVPTMLSQITANRRLSSSTFKEITDDFGTELAIDHVLFKAGLQESYPNSSEEKRTLFNLLLCLAGNELVALIARLLEEQGLHVPAPTGGFVKNVDLFAYNDHCFPRRVGEMVVPPRRNFRPGAVTVQVRGMMQESEPAVSPEVSYLVQLNGESSERVLGYEWIESVLRSSPRTRAWLQRLLRWVPFAGSVLARL
ncbi:MAG: hypothetical protein ACOC47_06895 [Alkalispirochaetaceae bacterium]